MDLRSINKLVINLPSRPDRLDHVKYQLKDWQYQVMPGVISDTPMLGIAKAHIGCVFAAQQNNWSEVMIIEDDVVLREGTEEYFNEALSHAPEDWDILLGGLYETKSLTTVNEYWYKPAEFCGTHFYIVNSKAYDYILSYDGKQHIDRYLNWKGQGLNCYVTAKFVATQLPGKSDNTNRIEDYEYKLKKFKLL